MLVLAACTGGPGATLATAEAVRPAGSVRTVAIVLDGRRTSAEVYEPAQASAVAVVLAHGFLRSRATMAGHAAALARAGVLAVAPDLPYLIDSRDNARALRDLVVQLRRGDHAAPAAHVILVGFSAGGLAALLAAQSDGVAGYIGLDPFDRPSRIGLAAAQDLHKPAALLRAPPSACNAYAIAQPWARALPGIEVDRVFDSATHCDFESPTDWICRLACGAPDPLRQQAIEQELVRIVLRWQGGLLPR